MAKLTPDILDSLASLETTDPRFALRRLRPAFVQGARDCGAAVLNPKDDLGLSAALRAAVARRVALANNDTTTAEFYSKTLAGLPAAPAEIALAGGAAAETLPSPLSAVARHLDKVTSEPARAKAEDIALLTAAKLSDPQIVALSELIAFVNFQVRIAEGLRLLGDPA